MRDITAKHQDQIRYTNSKSVIKIIMMNQGESISRADIAKTLNMSPTSITRIANSLIDLGLIRQEEAFSRGVGRNGISLRMNKDMFYSLGFGMDSDYLKLCIMDCERNSIAEAIHKIKSGQHTLSEFLHQGKKMLEELCESENIDSARIKSMGISCCGNIDYLKGIAKFSPQLGWKNINIKHEAEKVFHLPVLCVDNDIKLALIGAVFLSEEMIDSDVVYLSIGSGVGAAIMHNGEVFRGVDNAAGEVGHTLFSLNGRKCVCGKAGCVSAYISEAGVVRECRDKGIEDMKSIMDAYDEGIPWAKEVIEELVNNMAISFCNMIYSYNPRYLLIGGNMIVDYPQLCDMAEKRTYELINEDFNISCIIKKRKFKNNELLGCAYIAQDRYIDSLLI